MSATTRLIDTLQSSQHLSFYQMMHYPVPRQKEYFMDAPLPTKQSLPPLQQKFSRDEKPDLMQEYLKELQQHSALYQSLPFVEVIYLCNSLTFNALHQHSDIDFFIIVRPGRIWTAKFFAMLKMSWKGIKRTAHKKVKKICLSFFVTADHQNLYPLSVRGVDVYLAYWIAHLVPLYHAAPTKPLQIRERNRRVQGVLPNFPGEQSIVLDMPLITGETPGKQRRERVLWGVWGDMLEFLLKLLQISIIMLKKRVHPQQNKDVIISDQMLKFHQDIREKVSLKYALKKK